ncbi:phosphoglucomutase-1-like [Hyalella azteca]|uniref:phosphoglucomutase (alpha-D-glucose-1,6-bisphosphate-dependent) n=2 Tax=Hyalella azteca TaxID=294128 RepID=A0A8B7N1P7_HYAAZ|nr:phosphoglucomutase-1-like [Hyalella azteca]
MSVPVVTVATKPFEGQKPGTSGLRKAVKVFQQEHYTENFIHCVLEAGKTVGQTLVVGGDGRYYGEEVVATIIRMAAAHGVAKLVVAKAGIMSTPAVSAIIRERGLCGGIVLTASHNPGGPDADFGIKYNCSNGGPAPDHVTNAMYGLTTQISQYKICPSLVCDIHIIQTSVFQVDGVGDFTVEVVDGVDGYVRLMKSIFDFPAIAAFIKSFPVLMDSLNGVTGPYVERIFLGELGAPPSSVRNTKPLPDFGGLHPDPNLTYAADLVATMRGTDLYKMGAAFDGDGDRNMILGERGFFVTPCDSVAVIANNASCIPYFRGGVGGLARSMPTSCALDRVAAALKVEMFEVPTGWKYFGNLMDAGRLAICGEESFGYSLPSGRVYPQVQSTLRYSLPSGTVYPHHLPSSTLTYPHHLPPSSTPIIYPHHLPHPLPHHLPSSTPISTITYSHHLPSSTLRYDYENCAAEPCGAMVARLRGLVDGVDGGLTGKSFVDGEKSYTVDRADDFSYTDPIDGSVATQQGIRVIMTDGSRIVYRLSGTGSSGATVRLYVESYERYEDGQEDRYLTDSQTVLRPLLNIALNIAQLKQYTGRDGPTVVT